MANVKDLINLCIMGWGRVHWENNTPPMSMPTSKQDNMMSVVGCAKVQATLLKSMIFSSCLNSRNLASSKGFVKISARLSWALTYFSLISPRLMWSRISDTESQYASSWSVAPGWERSWWHFHCHIKEALCHKWHCNPLKFASSIEVEHNNYRWPHTRLRWRRETHNFAS